MYQSSRTALALMALASSLPVFTQVAAAGEGGSSMSNLAQREVIRRQNAISESDTLLNEGRAAYAKQDFQQAVDKYRQALDRLPDAPMVSDRRQSYIAHLSDASVALAMHHRKVGKYTEARTLLENVQANDPENLDVKRELAYLDDPIRTNPALTYEHTQNVDKVRRGLYTAEGNFNLGKYDDAKREYHKVLTYDKYNTAARRGLERVASARSDYYRAAYDHTRAELLSQVDAAWELTVPTDTVEADTTFGTQASNRDGVAYLQSKLDNIIIPKVAFDDATVDEVITFLRQRASELDTELDPAKKGINLNARGAKGGSVSAPATALDAAATAEAPSIGSSDLGGKRINYVGTNLPIGQVLKYVSEQAGLRIKLDNFAVTLVPISEEGTEVLQRTFRVAPDFAASLGSGVAAAEGGAAADPFAEKAAAPKIGPRAPIIDILKANGVNFGEGTSATLSSNGALLVTNTPQELEKVENLINAVGNTKPKQVKITTKFVEISQNNTEELGFDWIVGASGTNEFRLSGGTPGNQLGRTAADFIRTVGTGGGRNVNGIPVDPAADTSFGVTNGLRSGDTAFNGNSIDAILNNPSRGSQPANVSPGIAALTGLFSENQIQLIMRGLSQKKGTDLMTAPSVTAKSGQLAKIEIIREFIYPTEYEPPELPQSTGNSGGSSSLFGGGSSGGAFPVTPATPTAFQTRNTGVTLEITPTIGENDFAVSLQFAPEITEFEGFVNYGSPIQASSTSPLGIVTPVVLTENRIEMPVFSSRRVKTELTLYDGYTVAVGGLMREDVQNVEDKVPILGDIPFIGRLFQTKGENRVKSNLIIFVTAQIIDATGRPLRGDGSVQSSLPSSSGGELGTGVLPTLSNQ